MENQLSVIRRLRRTLVTLFSWILFGICLVVVLSEIFGFHLPAFAHREPQQITTHHHDGILDLQSIWNEMEGVYHTS